MKKVIKNFISVSDSPGGGWMWKWKKIHQNSSKVNFYYNLFMRAVGKVKKIAGNELISES